jgi:hypothetical protein
MESRTKNENGGFEEIVRHASLLPCLVETVDHSTVDYGRETRKAGEDKDGDAEGAPLPALEAWVKNEEGG